MLAQTSGRFGSMVAFFFVALLLVTPFALVTLRRVRDRRRAGRVADSEAAAAVSAGELRRGEGRRSATHEVADGEVADDLADAIAAIEEGAGGGDPFTVELAPSPTHDGRSVDPAMAVAVVEDALRRSRLVVRRQGSAATGWRWQCDPTDRPLQE